MSEESEDDYASVMDKRLYQIFNLDDSLHSSGTRRKLDNEQDNDPMFIPMLSQYLEDVASNNVGSKIKISDVRIIENKLFEKFTKTFGISKKLLTSCYDSAELEIKQKLIK